MAWHGKIRPGLLLLLFSFVVISEATAKALEQYRYETAYACEGKTLKIECKDGELIKLIRANYGRFSITICNDHGNTDWSVNCMSPKSLRVLHARCSYKSECSVEVNSEVFGEPCKGTPKYIEAQYRCEDDLERLKEAYTFSTGVLEPEPGRLLYFSILEKCTHYQNCSIPAITSMFGDPCPGTHKYLEAHYQCLPATTTTTTSRPSPPWLITSQPPMWTTIKTPSARPSTTKVTISPPSPIPGPLSTSTSVNIPSSTSKGQHEAPVEYTGRKDEGNWEWEPKEPNPYEITTLPLTTVTPNGNSVKRLSTSDATSTFSYAPSVPSVYPWPKDSEYLPYHCNSTTIRNILWKTTHVNKTAVQPCPPGTTGFAKWHCSEGTSNDHEWTPVNPDLSECRSVWLTSLEQRLLLGKDLLMSIIRDLSTVTGSTVLYGGDMAITTKIIQKMTEKMSQDIQTFPDTRQREEIVGEMLGYVTKTSSNLLDATQDSSWKDLSYKEQMSVATSLLIGLEENAFLLADTVTSQKTVNRDEKNIILSVRVLDTKFLSHESFPSEDRNTDWRPSSDLIELSKEALLENNDGNLVRLVFVAFDRLEEILQWRPDNSDNSNNVTTILNSKVISASLGKGRHIQLKKPVRLTLKHIKTENVSNPRCVFWDYTTNAWSEEGCHVDTSDSNYTHTVCFCDHLTNFAILMDIHDVYLPINHEIALQVITYIGCIVSIICLILAIMTFQLFRGLKGDRTTIHCNLCTCLLIAEIIFLVGIDRTGNRIFCGVVAGFLHYFFLCAFIWMLFEGFQLYVMLIEVFEVEKSRIQWYYIAAYGLPLLIVFASAAVYPQGYGTMKHCWLTTDNYFIYTFVVPVLLVMMLNFIFLTVAILKMCKHASASVSMKNKEHSRLASTRAWLKGAFVLVFLLGLTWVSGFLYINQESLAMAYVFAIFNSLQGFFIFLFHCVQNEKVRKEYRKFIRRHSWLPKCLRCSKSGSGPGGSSSANTGSCTTSGGPGKERRPSLFGSNGNPSGGTNSHSTDNSVLTPHGTSLQRSWNSQSCTNVNRACRTPVPTSTSANMAATLFRPPRPTDSVPSPDLEAPNTSTLPYIRNFYKNSIINPNIPKSVSTWGPLHKPLHWKNISFKSYSRDSGHGGSEQEESPRSQMIIAEAHRISAALAKENQRQIPPSHQANFSEYGMRPSGQQAHCVATGRKKLNSTKPLHWGHHTYTEIYDGQNPRGFLNAEDDPVYEEIDRNEIQVSDMSDEDAKRQSDMSRQSSRSYGDHRPLIPYSPGTERGFLEVLGNNKEMDSYRLRCNNVGLPYRTPQGDAAMRSLAAVLDGETVVCHLEPQEMFPPQHLDVHYVSRTLSQLPPYSES